MSITQVQRWVMSALAVTTILHLSAGLIIAAIFLDDSRVDGRVGLNIIAGAGRGRRGGRRARHPPEERSSARGCCSGLVPTAVGLYLTF